MDDNDEGDDESETQTEWEPVTEDEFVIMKLLEEETATNGGQTPVAAELPLVKPMAAVRLSAPTNPQWDGITGNGVWDQVENSGIDDDHTGSYKYRLYFTGSNPTAPNDVDAYFVQSSINTNHTGPTFSCNFSSHIEEEGLGEGYYFFAVSARGDGVTYTQSDWSVMSDAFYYAPPTAELPKPVLPEPQKPDRQGWKVDTSSGTATYIAIWEDNVIYVDDDVASVTIYRGSEEIGNNLWKIGEVREEGLGGMDITRHVSGNGNYRFTVRIQSSRPNEYLSSAASDYSDWLTIGNSGGGGGGRSRNGGSSGGGGGSNTNTISLGTSAGTSAPVTQTASSISSLAATATASGSTTAQSSGAGEVTVQAAAWSQLSGLSFRHDTVVNGAVQVRVTISDPSSINQDLKVSGYTTGPNVEAVSNTINQYFDNTTRVMHLDQTGSFGQPVRIAAKFDLTGMDTANLIFYSYNRETNSYAMIQNPNYSIDSNGYVHFTTDQAGSIIVSDGKLIKK